MLGWEKSPYLRPFHAQDCEDHKMNLYIGAGLFSQVN